MVMKVNLILILNLVLVLVLPQILLASDAQVLVQCRLLVERDQAQLVNGEIRRVLSLPFSTTESGRNVQLQVTDGELQVDITSDFHLEYHQGVLRLFHGKFIISDQVTGQNFSTYVESLENLRPLLIKYQAQFWRLGALVEFDAKLLCEINN